MFSRSAGRDQAAFCVRRLASPSRCSPALCKSLSGEELDEFGVIDVEPGKRFIHYTLSDESSADRYPGTIERASIRGMPDRDGPSLVIRRHTAEEHAYGYLAALSDISDEEDNGSGLCRTDQGLFTLTPRPNRADFSHPLVISSRNTRRIISWARITGISRWPLMEPKSACRITRCRRCHLNHRYRRRLRRSAKLGRVLGITGGNGAGVVGGGSIFASKRRPDERSVIRLWLAPISRNRCAFCPTVPIRVGAHPFRTNLPTLRSRANPV
jgi:hypothetical protein